MPPGIGYGRSGYKRLRSRGVSKASARRQAFKRPTATPRASARARTRASAQARFKR